MRIAPTDFFSFRTVAGLAGFGALLALVYVTNIVFFAHRVEFLIKHGKWIILSIFLGIWVFSVLAMVIAAIQPNWFVRLFWALVIAVSTSASRAFFVASGAEMSPYDFVSLWTARHEVDRALEFYQNAGISAAAWLLLTVLVFAVPPVFRSPILRRYISRLMWVPAVPIIIVAAIMLTRNGSGYDGMPSQIQPLAIGLAVSVKSLTHETPERMPMTWQPVAKPAIRNIVVLIDESIRPDYIDWLPGNPYTPAMAGHKDRFTDFGQAAAGANCSAKANALLRLGATWADPVTSVQTNPSIWQYAKAAGYRTVYIDGQSGFIKSGKKIQNYMTFTEIKDIDGFYTFDDTPAPDLDFELLDIVNRELSGDTPVFIYANKNGAHFPYDAGYPADESVFVPTMAMTAEPTPVERINSYHNIVRWSVDKFFDKLFDQTDLSDTLVVYTSDHGQALNGGFTHCTTQDPDPRQGLVPLYVLTEEPDLLRRFSAAARLNHNRATHFAITPTLLDLMGYSAANIKATYGPSLFEPQQESPYFISKSLFGMFGIDDFRNPIDLNADYLEENAFPEPAKD